MRSTPKNDGLRRPKTGAYSGFGGLTLYTGSGPPLLGDRPHTPKAGLRGTAPARQQPNQSQNRQRERRRTPARGVGGFLCLLWPVPSALCWSLRRFFGARQSSEAGAKPTAYCLSLSLSLSLFLHPFPGTLHAIGSSFLSLPGPSTHCTQPPPEGLWAAGEPEWASAPAFRLRNPPNLQAKPAVYAPFVWVLGFFPLAWGKVCILLSGCGFLCRLPLSPFFLSFPPKANEHPEEPENPP